MYSIPIERDGIQRKKKKKRRKDEPWTHCRVEREREETGIFQRMNHKRVQGEEEEGEEIKILYPQPFGQTLEPLISDYLQGSFFFSFMGPKMDVYV